HSDNTPAHSDNTRRRTLFFALTPPRAVILSRFWLRVPVVRRCLVACHSRRKHAAQAATQSPAQTTPSASLAAELFSRSRRPPEPPPPVAACCSSRSAPS